MPHLADSRMSGGNDERSELEMRHDVRFRFRRIVGQPRKALLPKCGLCVCVMIDDVVLNYFFMCAVVT